MRDTNENKTVRARVNEFVKNNSRRILAEIGINHSEAIRIFLTRISNDGKVPTELLDTDKKALDIVSNGEIRNND